MIVFNCVDCSASYDDWEKANRHRESTGHGFKAEDEEHILKQSLMPKDYHVPTA